MESKTTLPISEARKRIFEIAQKVQKPAIHYTFTEKGKPKVVVMSVDEFESWQETLEVVRDFPALEKDIKKAEKQYKKGEYKTLEDFLLKEGFCLSSKSTNRNVSRSSLKSRGKRSR